MTPEMIETIRERMLIIWQANRLLYRDIAKKAQYHPDAIGHFLRGMPAYQTEAIAQAIIRAFPEVADGMICPVCGREFTH